MCGRFTLTISAEELMNRFLLTQLPDRYSPRFNIAPGQLILAIITDYNQSVRAGFLRWGLIPAWSKDEKIGNKMINARSETLHEKPAFKSLLSRKRCLIPADGFYEWKVTGEGKQPVRILLKDEQVFSMAGLYDTWLNSEGQKVHSCTVITTQANDLISPIHHRMPVILKPEEEAIWLDRDIQDNKRLSGLLQSFHPDQMKVYPVSPDVGNVKNDHPGCISMH
ncbi:SOS response-associated peptidase [Ammoniphilus sp. YIM 78166]|uniref:SOS response-associated peptidase n=1 Tax=Ammoniphilus sp. YIM 78166 TaxID=1644106 RepID=UPI00106F1475|nr:SOS response-associated peptidase [Ammoniphilus sp. YIM 78166]